MIKTLVASGVLIFTMLLRAQQPAPIYNVTVIDRSTKAINYQYGQGPTKIDFRGTVLLPQGKGEATVEAKRGRTEIDAKFENVTAPSVYGREFLTYTLWAVTPEGAARNLGEVVPGSSNKAHLRVTTDLQTFGLIVSAEPYSAAPRPSNVVVLENEIRPDTLGTVQPINARTELMPRGNYTWSLPDQADAKTASAPKVSMSKYEELLAVYQAQNAIQIARAAGADTYAAETLQHAEAQFQSARQLEASKASSSKVIPIAKAAAQTAEDARAIAENRAQAAQLTKAEADVAQAQSEARNAQAEARAARAEAVAARQGAGAGNGVPAAEPAQPQPAGQKNELRRGLELALGNLFPTRDTPLGLVVTLPELSFQGNGVTPAALGNVNQLGAILAAYRGLRVDLESYGYGPGTARVDAVRGILENRGIPSSAITARGLGNSRPAALNADRGVDVIISGDPIGTPAPWERTSSTAPRALP